MIMLWNLFTKWLKCSHTSNVWLKALPSVDSTGTQGCQFWGNDAGCIAEFILFGGRERKSLKIQYNIMQHPVNAREKHITTDGTQLWMYRPPLSFCTSTNEWTISQKTKATDSRLLVLTLHVGNRSYWKSPEPSSAVQTPPAAVCGAVQTLSWRRPKPSRAVRTLSVGLRHPEPYNDRRIKWENARESGCS